MATQSKLELLMVLSDKLFNNKLMEVQNKLAGATDKMDAKLNRFSGNQVKLAAGVAAAFAAIGDVPEVTVNLYCCYEQLRDTSNISLNRDLGLKFLDFVDIINQIAQTVESEITGKLELVTEGFNKMDSIVDIYLLTYTCSGIAQKNPQQDEAGDYDTLELTPNISYDLD